MADKKAARESRSRVRARCRGQSRDRVETRNVTLMSAAHCGTCHRGHVMNERHCRSNLFQHFEISSFIMHFNPVNPVILSEK